MKELQRQGGTNPNIVIALCGNKCDLESKRKVSTSEAQTFAEENELLFMEVSAKTSMNVKELFFEIGKRLPKEKQEEIEEHSPIILKPTPEVGTKNCCY